MEGLSIDAESVKYIHLKFRADLNTGGKGWYNNNVYYNAYTQFYFLTSADDIWSQNKSFSVYYCEGELVDMYIEAKHSLWKDKITAIRFDPSEMLNGSAKVYLIELIGKAENEGVGKWMMDLGNKITLLEEKVEKLNAKLSLVDSYSYRLNKIEKKIKN